MHLSYLFAVVPLAAGASIPPTGRAEPAPLVSHDPADNVELSSEHIVKFKDGTHESTVHQVLANLEGNSSHIFDDVFHGFSKNLNETELDFVRNHPEVRAPAHTLKGVH
ncbi:hypothetical protein CDD83_6859 [Cordyceps sp. RAO-2017]|nr:hypothetical protein CDD83_6859 [Cordyceps sp. RAO-2017]